MAKVLRLLAIACIILAAIPAQARQTIDLSGEWDFRMDPKGVGADAAWYNEEIPYDRKIVVPGAWNAQGVGEESRKLFHDFPGPAWYRRKVAIPASWQGKVIWLKFGGVHRYADVWVNGIHVGEHIGYLTPFKFDISHSVNPGEDAVIAVRVDARQREDIDPLIGCFDVIDAMNITWGGMYRGVELEATDRVWIEDVFVVPRIASRTAEVRVELGALSTADGAARADLGMWGSSHPHPNPLPPAGEGTGGPAGDRINGLVQAIRIDAEALDSKGRKVGSGQATLAPHGLSTVIPVKMRDMKLWSPKQPHLYTIRVRLLAGTQEIDSLSDRFGMRELKAEGGRFLLNDKPIFLRGYGDDCIFPNTIAPPADKDEYYRRFRIAKDYGFNYARHHSWFPPAEYFDVADELGVMLQPEFPIAYQQFYDAATPEGKRLYLDQWRRIIKANRNHPSIVTWCMGNELWDGFDLAPEMYRTAKELDPTRLVIDSDGISLRDGSQRSRKTLDFLSCSFDEGRLFGFNDGKHDLGDRKPEKPIVVHEMGNFGTLPDLAQAELFHGGIRPFWLYDARELAKQKGIVGSLRKWVANSNKLQAVALKANIEDARRSPGISGYHVWLLQDYWTGSNGVLDMFYRPKGVSAAEFRKFNSSTVLLMDCPKRNFRAGERVTVDLIVSRYEDAPSADAELSWQLRLDGQVLLEARKTGLKVPAGTNTKLRTVDLRFPQVSEPTKLTMRAQLSDENGTFGNSWDFWVYPTARLSSGELVVDRCPQIRGLYPWAEDDSASLKPGSLLISRRSSPRLMEHLDQGGRVLLLSADRLLPTVGSSFKPCWWLGNAGQDSNVGTEIAPAHPALGSLKHEGWCDLQFYELVNGSKVALLDDLPAGIDPIVRCLDVYQAFRNKAYLFEVAVGRGRLLVSTFNFSEALRTQDPAAIYLLDQLIRYALSPQFAPEAALSAGDLSSAAPWTPPDVPRVNGFERLIACTNPEMTYPSHRDASGRCWLVRQLDGTHCLEWETAPVPPTGSEKLTIVWTAAMGYVSEPSGSFTISVNGRLVLNFDVFLLTKKWASAHADAELGFEVLKASGLDGFGVMYLTVPTSTLKTGKPAKISVTASASDSRRWFMLFDYQDTLSYENL